MSFSFFCSSIATFFLAKPIFPSLLSKYFYVMGECNSWLQNPKQVHYHWDKLLSLLFGKVCHCSLCSVWGWIVIGILSQINTSLFLVKHRDFCSSTVWLLIGDLSYKCVSLQFSLKANLLETGVIFQSLFIW